MMEASSTPLTDLFEREGEPSLVGGNRPFLLDDPDSVWLVASGRIEVFSTEVRGDQPHGQRHHFCSVMPGEALFGLGGGADLERGLLAVGAQNTRLLRLPAERMQEWSKAPDLAEFISTVVETWAAALSRGISQDIVVRADVAAGPHQEIHLKANQKVRAHRGLVWVEIVEGNALFLGMEEVSQEAGPRYVPLSSESWLMALTDMVLKTHATQDAVGTSPLWLGLKTFYEMLFRCEAMNRNLLAADEYNRLVERVELAHRARRDALASLSTVLKAPEAAVLAAAGGDHLLGACMLVGNAMGIRIRQHPDAQKGLPQKDPLDDIIRASRIRARHVRLRGRWWAEAQMLHNTMRTT